MILRFYYIDDLSWVQVSHRMNEVFPKKRKAYTEDSCRCKHNRYLEKFENDGNDGFKMLIWYKAERNKLDG